MVVLLWVAFGIGVVGLVVGLVFSAVRSRNDPGALDRIVALTPVPADVQDAARWHVDQRQRGMAIRLVRRSARLGLAEAVAVVDALTAERHVPTSYDGSVRVLDTEYPELAAHLRQLTVQGQMVLAMRTLRRHVPITLVHAKHLIDTLAR